MTPPARLLASAACLLIGAGAASAQAPYRTVAIPAIPPGEICSADKVGLVDEAMRANAAAAENAQIAVRAVAERQASGRLDDLPRLRAERDRRAEEWRRAEAALEGAQRAPSRDCTPQQAQSDVDEEAPPTIAETPLPSPPAETPAARAPGVGPGPAPSAPPRAADRSTPPPAPPVAAGAAAAAAARPPVSLAIALDAPARCQANAACSVSVTVENRGATAFPSPLLAAVALGFDGGTVASVTPETWACGRGGENLSCATGQLALEPGASTRFTIDWRLPARLRRPSATVCARIVWPGQSAGSVYRAEQVMAVQYALQRAGFDTGGLSGRIGPRTLEAIGQARGRGAGGSGITAELLGNLFGANGALAGDDEAANDSACASVAFGEAAPVASAPPAVAPPVAAAPPARRPQVEARRSEESESEPAEERVAPPRRAPPRVVRPRVEREPPPRVEARRRAPIVRDYDDDDDEIIYRTPRRFERRGTVVYGPNGPIVVYPGRPVEPWGFPRW